MHSDKAMCEMLLAAINTGNIVTSPTRLAAVLFSEVPIANEKHRCIFSFLGEHVPATLLNFLKSFQLDKIGDEILGRLISAPLDKPLYVGLPFRSPQGFWQLYHEAGQKQPSRNDDFEPTIPATKVVALRIPIPGLCGTFDKQTPNKNARFSISTKQGKRGDTMSHPLLSQNEEKGVPDINPLQVVLEAATMVGDNSIFSRSTIVYELVQFKWKHLSVPFQREAAFYLVYSVFCSFLSWSIAHTNNLDTQKKLNRYFLTAPGVLGCMCSVILFLMSGGYLWREIKQFLFQFKIKNMCAKQEDIKWARALRTLRFTFWHHFVKDAWNFIDFFAFVAQMTTDVMFFCVAYGQQQLAAISILLILLKLCSYARVFQGWGPFVRMIYYTCCNTFHFLTMVLILLAGFGLAFYVLLYQEEGFTSWSDSFLSTFMLLFGQFQGVLSVQSCQWSFSTFLMLVILVLTAIILLNLLVAILSSAYEETIRNAEQDTVLQLAEMIVEAETVDKIGTKFKELFPTWVHILKPAEREQTFSKARD